MESTTISLAKVLPLIQRVADNNMKVFFNNTGRLEQFFTYKANLIDVHKDVIRIALGKLTTAEYGEELRLTIIKFLQTGYTIIFNFGLNEAFDIVGLFQQFSWYKDDFFENVNYLNTDYLKEKNIVAEEDDFDVTGSNPGCYKVRDNARIHFLSGLGEDLKEKFMLANSKIPMISIVVE
jgi:hypothetical protein